MAIDTPQLLQTYLADGLSGKTLPSTREPLWTGLVLAHSCCY
jgi:hypothetical protein